MTRLDNVLTLGMIQEEATGLPPGMSGTEVEQGSGTDPGSSAPGGQNTGTGNFPFIWMMLPIILMFLIMTSMGGRKERKRRKAMLGSLKKRDRVQTQGGIIGVITEIKTDEIVLKVDEGSNTKIRFARTAIQHVLRSTAGSDAAEEIETVPAN